jgi:hypothetical protein
MGDREFLNEMDFGRPTGRECNEFASTALEGGRRS